MGLEEKQGLHGAPKLSACARQASLEGMFQRQGSQETSYHKATIHLTFSVV